MVEMELDRLKELDEDDSVIMLSVKQLIAKAEATKKKEEFFKKEYS